MERVARAWMSEFIPIHSRTVPSGAKSGTARSATQRHSPLAWWTRYSTEKGALARAAPSTSGNGAGNPAPDPLPALPHADPFASRIDLPARRTLIEQPVEPLPDGRAEALGSEDVEVLSLRLRRRPAEDALRALVEED